MKSLKVFQFCCFNFLLFLFHYRVILGSGKYRIPWLGSFKASIDDWKVEDNITNDEENFIDLFDKFSDARVSILVEGETCKGKTSLLHQICLDWGREASYLQHFHLVVFLDCSTIPDQAKRMAYIFKIFCQPILVISLFQPRV